MSALHVRDVPEPVMAALRERASLHGRSVQEEVRLILAAAAAEPKDGPGPEPLRLTTVRTGGAGRFCGNTSRWSLDHARSTGSA